MIDGISFLHEEYGISVGIAVIILYACFLWKEALERHRGQMLVQSIIALITLLALALIVLEPVHQVEVNERQGLLLTEGFEEAKKDSLVERYPGLTVLEYHPERSIRTDLDSLTSLFVLGNGIKSFDFWQFKNIPTAFVPNAIPSGISRIKYPKSLVLGEALRLSGLYTKPKKGTFLVLEDPAGNGLDSVQLEKKEEVGFTLQTTPKVSGTFIYSVTEKDSTGNVQKTEPLPIQIGDKNTLRVLILNDFPTFETKYLKNFLAESGHEVVVRSQLTQGKYKFEYFNTASKPMYQITEEVLQDFHLVIADADTYYGFGSVLKNRLEKRIRENGLGLFLQPTNALFNRYANSSYFSFSRDGVNETNLGGSNNGLEKYPYAFESGVAQQPIDLDANKPIAAYKQFGLGRVVTTTLQNSYQLVLDGKEREYGRFWTQLLDKTIPQAKADIQWASNTLFPRPNAPFDFTLRTNLEEFTVVDTDSSTVGLLQNPQIPSLYSGTTYPKKSGWNVLKMTSDSTANYAYYVMNPTDWKSLEISKSISENQKEFQKVLNENRTVWVDRPISLIWFYIPFLLGIGWLWLAPKRLGD